MKIQITKRTWHDEKVEVEVPYYYKHDLAPDDSDSVIYGKIEISQITKIQVSKGFNGSKSFEMEIVKGRFISYESYMTDGTYESSEREFLAARDEMLDAIQSI